VFTTPLLNWWAAYRFEAENQYKLEIQTVQSRDVSLA